jgi:hypothetical protein
MNFANKFGVYRDFYYLCTLKADSRLCRWSKDERKVRAT